ncbi:hypothetical protein FK535_07360 [Mycolicibacterium sp. 018/SC-01/001]|uniref:DUF5994 family protein n=1 Tax=Mycolicibacterium sp. 018/SC-01/001 TaxID=2592069 RepID=UPI00117E346E|nr:DUF5994 family protein [Mycolicibacterium sp. 018/SC-01/001]TRW86273.1 hypothetical protein FK535_07360 [Mycolicibacterium sp. 018/SC-01/001]
MNGIPRARRAAKPVRVTLAPQRGGVIDGAWWPHSSAIAAELPDLIGALHRALGEVVSMQINWSPTEGQMDLETIATGSRMASPGGHHRRPRLMSIVGRDAGVKLLVVPSMTSQTLGSMVLRAAAGLPAVAGSTHERAYETACLVVGLARAESTTWNGSGTS